MRAVRLFQHRVIRVILDSSWVLWVPFLWLCIPLPFGFVATGSHVASRVATAGGGHGAWRSHGCCSRCSMGKWLGSRTPFRTSSIDDPTFGLPNRGRFSGLHQAVGQLWPCSAVAKDVGRLNRIGICSIPLRSVLEAERWARLLCWSHSVSISFGQWLSLSQNTLRRDSCTSFFSQNKGYDCLQCGGSSLCEEWREEQIVGLGAGDFSFACEMPSPAGDLLALPKQHECRWPPTY